MLNSGVKLFSENSPFEKVLKDFQESGVEVLACGLCVEFYGLKQVVPKEQITNMFAICEYINAAAKIISP
jgi:intracellular sulfur oxidation DsrE/DsrF family protein